MLSWDTEGFMDKFVVIIAEHIDFSLCRNTNARKVCDMF